MKKTKTSFEEIQLSLFDKLDATLAILHDACPPQEAEVQSVPCVHKQAYGKIINNFKRSKNIELDCNMTVIVRELAICAPSWREYYHNYAERLQKYLYDQYLKGMYDEEEGHRLYFNTIPYILEQYAKEFGGIGCNMTLAGKHALADELLSYYTEDFCLHPDGGLLEVKAS